MESAWERRERLTESALDDQGKARREALSGAVRGRRVIAVPAPPWDVP